MVKNSLTYLILLILIASCQTKVDSLQYLGEIQKSDYDLTKSKEFNSNTFKVTYEPIEKRILSRNANITEKEYHDLSKELDNELFFKFQIASENNLNQLITGQIDYFSHFIKNRFALIINEKDTVQPELFQLEHTYGLTPYITYLISFNPESEVNSFSFYYDDEVFGVGLLKYHYSESQLSKLPVISW